MENQNQQQQNNNQTNNYTENPQNGQNYSKNPNFQADNNFNGNPYQNNYGFQGSYQQQSGQYYQPPINNQQYYCPPPVIKRNVRETEPGYSQGIASMILGICSLLFFYTGISLISAIVGLVLGISSSKKSKQFNLKNNYSLAGIITSAVSISIILFFILIVVFVLVGIIAYSPSDYSDIISSASYIA